MRVSLYQHTVVVITKGHSLLKLSQTHFLFLFWWVIQWKQSTGVSNSHLKHIHLQINYYRSFVPYDNNTHLLYNYYLIFSFNKNGELKFMIHVFPCHRLCYSVNFLYSHTHTMMKSQKPKMHKKFLVAYSTRLALQQRLFFFCILVTNIITGK